MIDSLINSIHTKQWDVARQTLSDIISSREEGLSREISQANAQRQDTFASVHVGIDKVRSTIAALKNASYQWEEGQFQTFDATTDEQKEGNFLLSLTLSAVSRRSDETNAFLAFLDLLLAAPAHPSSPPASFSLANVNAWVVLRKLEYHPAGHIIATYPTYPLYVAAEKGLLATAKRLVEAGADVNCRGDICGQYCCHQPSGASPSEDDPCFITPLLIAAMRCQWRVLLFLVSLDHEKHAVKDYYSVTDNFGDNILHWLCMFRWPERRDPFTYNEVQHDADEAVAIQNGTYDASDWESIAVPTIVKILLLDRAPFLLCQPNHEGELPIHRAIHNNVQLVTLFANLAERRQFSCDYFYSSDNNEDNERSSFPCPLGLPDMGGMTPLAHCLKAARSFESFGNGHDACDPISLAQWLIEEKGIDVDTGRRVLEGSSSSSHPQYSYNAGREQRPVHAEWTRPINFVSTVAGLELMLEHGLHTSRLCANVLSGGVGHGEGCHY